MPNWMIAKPADFDLTVISPLISTTLNEVGARSGSAAGMAEVCKHNTNDVQRVEIVQHILGSRDLWLLGCRSSGFYFSTGCTSGFAVAV